MAVKKLAPEEIARYTAQADALRAKDDADGRRRELERAACAGLSDAALEAGAVAKMREALEEVYFESNRNCLGPVVRGAVSAALALVQAPEVTDASL